MVTWSRLFIMILGPCVASHTSVNRKLSALRDGGNVDSSSSSAVAAAVISQQPASSSDDDEGDDLEGVDFPYENLVLQGGGSKGPAYVGALRELERLGHLSKFKRFAGTSVGAVAAATIAVGHGVDRLKWVLTEADYEDNDCGCCILIPNMLKSFGWHEGRAVYNLYGRVIEEKLGDRDATFKDLYDKTGVELCLVVTNVSVMLEEYCHVKTTPNLPIRAAIRMSMSVPGPYFPFKREYMGQTDYFVDGGVVCNYPIHCYDGWWLSMKPEDSFLKRMQPLEDVTRLLSKKERFGTTRNEKTLGMILHCDTDTHVLPTNPELQAVTAPIPDTKLSRAHAQTKRERELGLREHRLLTDAMTRFLKVLEDHNLDGNDTISIDEFKRAMKDSTEFKIEHLRALFGDELSSEEIFASLDTNHDGQIDFPELMSLAEGVGVGWQTHHIGCNRLKINSVSEFYGGLIETMLRNVMRAFVEGDDIERTVDIDTVYLSGFNLLEQADVDFLFEQGRRAVRAFLKYQKKRAESADRTVDE